MVFATDFDPIDSRSTSSPRRKSNQAKISPLHQTNRLIAQANQAQKAVQTPGQTSAHLSARRSVQEIAYQEQAEAGVELAVANRVTSSVRPSSATADPSVATLPVGGSSVSSLRQPKLPLGLKLLSQVQHGSTAVASVLIAGALALYGSSVYVDRSVNRTTDHLNRLQSESQQLTAANESIKQSLAEQAKSENSGLEPYEAGDVLFVTPEPVRPENEVSEGAEVEQFRPQGY
ncbi:MAG: hypothetical protein AAFR25_01295 [Cyanobacteria bacterium J06629_19]